VRCGEVVERDDRRQVPFEAVVDDRLVVVEGGLVEDAGFRFDAGPFDGEPVDVQAQAGGEADVLTPPVPAVARSTGGFGEDGGADVFEVPGVAAGVVALGLVAGAGDSPRIVTGPAPSSFRVSSIQSAV
jgi:hypothetical protein